MTTRNAFAAALQKAAHNAVDFMLNELRKNGVDHGDVRRVELTKHVTGYTGYYSASDLHADLQVSVTIHDDGDIIYAIEHQVPGRPKAGPRQRVSIHESREVHERVMREMAKLRC